MSPLVAVYTVAFILLVTAFVFLFQMSRAREAAEKAAAELDWVHEILLRAAKQINSDEEDAIVAGLQLLAEYNAPDFRVKLFRRIEDLQRRKDLPNAAKQAGWTRDTIVRQAVSRGGQALGGIARKRPE